MEKLPPFEEMERLARENPEELEKMKRRMVDEVIQSAPEHKRKRLEGLQFQIDAKIKTSKTPFQAMERIYDDMMDNFLVLNEHLQQLSKASRQANENNCQNDLENKSQPSNLKVVVTNKKNKDDV